MSRSLLIFVSVSAVFLLARVGVAEPPGLPASGLLVLRNGEVIAGRVTKAGDRYLVAVADGGELRIPERDVEMQCVDLDEAYLRRRERLGPRSASAHVALADWCLRYSLHSRAADELLAALALDPQHPKIKLVERRLQTAVSVPVSSVATTGQKPAVVSLDTLERTSRELPAEAVETFASRIQPLLLNRCGANSCHGPRTDSAFRLVRPGAGDTLTRRFTQRNLYSATQAINFAAPQASPLLTVPAGPHGNLASAVFGDRDTEQFRMLAAWVGEAARAKATTASPDTIASRPTELMQASYNEPVRLPQDEAEANGQPASGFATGRAAQAADPFDPEVFNQRYLAPAPVTPK